MKHRQWRGWSRLVSDKRNFFGAPQRTRLVTVSCRLPLFDIQPRHRVLKRRSALAPPRRWRPRPKPRTWRRSSRRPCANAPPTSRSRPSQSSSTSLSSLPNQIRFFLKKKISSSCFFVFTIRLEMYVSSCQLLDFDVVKSCVIL